MIEPPVPTPEHERLRVFLGTWEGEETVFASPFTEPGSARGFVSTTLEVDGFYVAQDYRQEREGRTSFRAKGLLTHDQADGLVKLYWFDSLGFAPPAPASGRWADDTLTLVRASIRGAARYRYMLDGPDRYALRIQFSPDLDGWSDVLHATYRRV